MYKLFLHFRCVYYLFLGHRKLAFISYKYTLYNIQIMFYKTLQHLLCMNIYKDFMKSRLQKSTTTQSSVIIKQSVQIKLQVSLTVGPRLWFSRNITPGHTKVQDKLMSPVYFVSYLFICNLVVMVTNYLVYMSKVSFKQHVLLILQNNAQTQHGCYTNICYMSLHVWKF